MFIKNMDHSVKKQRRRPADQPVHPQWFRNNTASPKAVGGGTVGWQRPLFSRKKVLAEPLFYPNMLIWHLSTAVLNAHKTYGLLREKTKAQTSLCIRSGLEITQLLQRPSAAVQSVGKDHFLVGKMF